MSWKLDNKTPVYVQLIDEIKRRIVTGVYGPGSRLPSVRDLASEASVNPNTMQRAMGELEAEGFITTLRTSGKVVTEDEGMLYEARKNMARAQVWDFVGRMSALGFTKEDVIDMISDGGNDGHTV